jgi:predicted transposase YdaD
MILDILNIRGIEASSVYQAIYARGYALGYAKGYHRGRVKGRRESLLRLGRKKWGEPDERVLAQIAAIDDLDRLGLLIDRIFDASASSWDELVPPAEASV